MGMHTLSSSMLPDQAIDNLEELDGSIVLLLGKGLSWEPRELTSLCTTVAVAMWE